MAYLGAIYSPELMAPELDIASAPVLNIGAQFSTKLRVTGSIGITSFGTDYRGPIHLRFSGVLVINNSASLICKGGENITTEAGDTCIVYPKVTTSGIPDGWIIVEYNRAAISPDTTRAIIGGTGGAILYQTAANITGFISPGTAGYALVSAGTGSPPTWNAVVRPNVETTFTAQQVPFSAALTDGATITWNGATHGHVARLTLGGNRTMGAPTNIKQYGMYLLRVAQDVTGSRTIAWNAAFKFGSSGAPTLTTTASKVDILSFIGGASNTLEFLGIRKNAI